MADLPEDRDQTFIDGVSQISAETMNEGLQDFVVQAHRMLRGPGYQRRDDFDGDALDTFKWIDTVTATGTVTVGDDNTNGGFGAVTLATGGATGDAAIKSRLLPIGAVDFSYEARVRTATLTSGEVIIGINSATAGEKCFFYWSASGNWFANVANVTTDLGVAPSATYQRLVIKRKSGVVKFYVNDVATGDELHSVAFATSIAAGFEHLSIFASSGSVAFKADHSTVWVNR